jgi:hypothetical protein
MDKIRSYPTSVPAENRLNRLRKAWITGTALIVLLITLVALNARAAATQSLAGSQDITQSFPLPYDATGAMLDAVVFSHQVQPAFSGLAYDATGAMLEAVVFPTYADQPVLALPSPGLAYDATGAMLSAVVFSHQVRPVSYPLWYDATGAMLEAVVFPKYSE